MNELGINYNPNAQISEETKQQYKEYFDAYEWKGNYQGNRLICRDCANYINEFVKDIGLINQCKILNEKYPENKIDICDRNNICKYYKRPNRLIKHYGELNFDDYIEYLRDGFYGGCCHDKRLIINANNYLTIDGTKYFIAYIDFINLDIIVNGEINCVGYWEQKGKSKRKGKNVYLREAAPMTLRWLVDKYNNVKY